MSRKELVCRFCDATGLHWEPSSRGKFRLADSANRFHDCPEFSKPAQHESHATIPRRRRPDSNDLAIKVRQWLTNYGDFLTEDAETALLDILGEQSVNKRRY